MYEKTTWANGDVITAEKLNHIENGILGNNFIIRDVFNESLDETEYISDSVFDLDVQYDHMWYIDQLGIFYQLTYLNNMSFSVVWFNPCNDPSVTAFYFYHDPSDDTNLKYIKNNYVASLQFVIDD